MQTLDKEFSTTLAIVESLFGTSYVRERILRLQEIFDVSEKLWKDQLHSAGNGRIKYLLIAEAPPWSESGNVNYIYNYRTKPSGLIQAISKAFFGEFIYQNIGLQETLLKLRERGFLLFDSIPFSLNYSNKNRRNSKKYQSLIDETAKSYLQDKLCNSDINWDADVKVAFSVYKNGLSIIESVNSKLQISNGGRMLSICKKQIAVNNAWYPCGIKIRNIYALPKGENK